MREEKKVIPIDTYEEGAVIEGLNKIRTEQLEQGKDTDFVNDLMLKIIRTRPKKVRNRDEAR